MGRRGILNPFGGAGLLEGERFWGWSGRLEVWWGWELEWLVLELRGLGWRLLGGRDESVLRGVVG